MRKPFITGNWKMHLTDEEALQFVDHVKDKLPSEEKVTTAICAQAVSLKGLKERASGSALHIGAQTMHEEEKGAFTGEISPRTLASIGIRLVILGHSERREYFNETNERVNSKIHAALKHGFTPIVCVGEKLAEREAGKAQKVVENQLEMALKGVDPADAVNIVIAYEPVWAIGTGRSSNPEQSQEMCAAIRAYIREQYGESTSEAVVIQYGGSVKPENIASYLEKEDIDGALVGGASVTPDSFLALVEAAIK